MNASSTRASRSPVRTCVGCRRHDDRSALLRVVAVGAGAQVAIRPDPSRRSPGRGAWLHPVAACVDLADRRKAVGRALRLAGAVDLRDVRAYVEALGLDEVTQHPAGTREGGGPTTERKRV